MGNQKEGGMKRKWPIVAYAVLHERGDGILTDSGRLPIYWYRRNAVRRALDYWGADAGPKPPIARVEIQFAELRRKRKGTA